MRTVSLYSFFSFFFFLFIYRGGRKRLFTSSCSSLQQLGTSEGGCFSSLREHCTSAFFFFLFQQVSAMKNALLAKFLDDFCPYFNGITK